MFRRLVFTLCAGAALTLALPAGAGAQDPNLFCKPGSYCIAVAKEKGQVRLRLLLQSRGTKYRLCVTPPADSGASRSCKTFKVRTLGTVRGSDVRWSSHFPNRGAGTYKVRWSMRGKTMGKTLKFQRG